MDVRTAVQLPPDGHDLLRAACHELRSPLNALLGWVHVLELKHSDDSGVAAITPRLQRSARLLLRIVNDLQDLDHLRRGKFRVDLRPFKLRESIEAAIDAQQGQAQVRGITLAASLPEACDTGIEGDPSRLQQLVEHLLRNAIRHSDQHSAVEVRCERAEGELAIQVQDHGRGMSTEEIERLFRTDGPEVGMAEADAVRAAGLGAGLPLSAEIVRRHGGTIVVTSQGLGHGTLVTVVLPARERTQPAVESQRQKKAG